MIMVATMTLHALAWVKIHEHMVLILLHILITALHMEKM